jgi:hypothetical protein
MGSGADKLRRFRPARAGGKLRAAVEKVNGALTQAPKKGNENGKGKRKGKPSKSRPL